MIFIYILNFIIGSCIFIISCLVATLFYNFFLILSSDFSGYLFVTILILSLIVFYFCFLGLAIACCRIITFCTPNKTGTFKNTSKIQILRITTDVLTSSLCSPFFSSMPFLLFFMGAVYGKKISFSGKIFNADLLNAGNNLLVGEGAFICGHLQQADKFILGKIEIGNDVTLGVRSFIMPNVTIGDGSIIAAYSVVTMGTTIPDNEIWGGIPAKKIGNRR